MVLSSNDISPNPLRYEVLHPHSLAATWSKLSSAPTLGPTISFSFFWFYLVQFLCVMVLFSIIKICRLFSIHPSISKASCFFKLFLKIVFKNIKNIVLVFFKYFFCYLNLIFYMFFFITKRNCERVILIFLVFFIIGFKNKK